MRSMQRLLAALLTAALILTPCPPAGASSSLVNILNNWQNTPEQNTYLWQHLQDLRKRNEHTPIPQNIIDDFNKFRVGTIEKLKAQSVSNLMKTGQYQPKALAGFLNTGTWQDPKKFGLGSDIDFTAVGRDPKTVKAFRQDFLKNLAETIKVGGGEKNIADKLDVNVYTMGGKEAGAFTTQGGKNFFEVYTTGKGSYQQILGSGEKMRIAGSRVDNAFIDLGRPVAQFTKADVASFQGELAKGVDKIAKGSPSADAAKKMAKQVERIEYTNVVAQNRVLGEGSCKVVQEALAIRGGAKLETALAGRISEFTKLGFSQKEALQLAQKAFIADSAKFAKASANISAIGAINELKAAGANLGKFSEMLNLASKGGKIALGTGLSALALYALYHAYTTEGKTGLLKEIVNLGIIGAFPPAGLAQLAGLGMQASSNLLKGMIKDFKEDMVMEQLFGKIKSDEDLVKAMQKFKDLDALKKYINEELEIVGLRDNDTINQRILDKAAAAFEAIAAQQKQKAEQDEELKKILDDLKNKVAQEQKDKAEEDQQAAKQTEKEIEEAKDKEGKKDKEGVQVAQEPVKEKEPEKDKDKDKGEDKDKEKDKDKEAEEAKTRPKEKQPQVLVTPPVSKEAPGETPPEGEGRRPRKKDPQAAKPEKEKPPEGEKTRIRIARLEASPNPVVAGQNTSYTIEVLSAVGGKVTLTFSSGKQGAGTKTINLETEPGRPYTGRITGKYPDPGKYTAALLASDAGGTDRQTVRITVTPKPTGATYRGSFTSKGISGRLTLRVQDGVVTGNLEGQLKDISGLRYIKNRVSGPVKGSYDPRSGGLQLQGTVRYEVQAERINQPSQRGIEDVGKGLADVIIVKIINGLNGKTASCSLGGTLRANQGNGKLTWKFHDGKTEQGTWQVQASPEGQRPTSKGIGAVASLH